MFLKLSVWTKSIWISWLGGAVILLLILWIFLSRTNREDPIPLPPSPKVEDIQLPTITPEDQKFIDDIKRAEEALEKKKEDTITGIEFFNEATKKNRDVTICEKIRIEEMHQNCKTQITNAIASAKKDPLVCDSLSGSDSDRCRDTVYFSSAMSQVSLSGTEYPLCEKIVDAELQNTCKKKTESVVLEMKQSIKWELSEKDCKEFKNKTVQWDCRTRVSVQNDYKILSEVSENPRYCLQFKFALGVEQYIIVI